MRKERRKTLVVNNLQSRLLLHTFGLVFGVSIGFILAFIFIFGVDQTPIFKASPFVRWAIFIIIAIILYLISYFTILKLSNRIYGPIYRLSGYLRRLSEGIDTGEIKFRKDDIINGIQEIYNNLYKLLSKTLRYDYNQLVNTFTELEDILDKIHRKTITEGELNDALENICSRLAKALDKTTHVIDQKNNDE